MASESARAPRASLRTRFPCAGADLAAARRCEEVVFGRHYGNTPEQLAHEYGPFEPATSFGGVFAPDGTALGAVRLLRPGPAPLKTLVDAGGHPWDVPAAVLDEVAGGVLGEGGSRTWDVATFGVDAHAAGADHRIARALFAVMFGAFRDNGVETFVAVLDHGARRAVELLGVRLLEFPGAAPAPYLGSPASVPAYRRVSDLHAEHARRHRHLHQQVFHGRGIAGLDHGTTAPGAFALPSSAGAVLA